MIAIEDSVTWEAYPKLNAWRLRISPKQQSIFEKTWNDYLNNGKWALLRPFYREQGKSSILAEISTLSGFCSEDEDHQNGNRLRLFLPGVLLTKEGLNYITIIKKYFEFQYGLFLNESEMRTISSDEIRDKMKLSQDETRTLGRLLQINNSLSGYGHDLSNWSVVTMKEVENIRSSHDIPKEMESWIEKNYFSENPVLLEDKIRKQYINPSVPALNWPGNPAESNLELTYSHESNPFQRRYQVFVSSTFNDLVDERKHVMHALLETKCIPSGMELFPAASTEQMKLIQSVIDDCDYYLIIIAGKYGTCGSDGISYTEMEFNYAVSTGKPIFAFFHNDIKKLAGEKLEETDEARRKLLTFTAKVKSHRLCHSWITAEGLASAVKTAIIHAIETNPKPGWVRADSVPTWKMVRNLEQRIEELEGRQRPATTQIFPEGDDKFEFAAKIHWEDADHPNKRYGNYNSLNKQFSMNWDQLFLHVAPSPGIKTSRLGLLRSFTHSLAKTFESKIKANAKGNVIRLDGTVNGELFDKILQTLLAKKLLKQVSPPKHVRTKILYWQLSPKGVQKLAELQAIRAKQIS